MRAAKIDANHEQVVSALRAAGASVQSLAGVGQTTANQLGVAGQNYANQVNQLGMTNAANQGNLALQRGNIAATQYGNYANVLGNALSKYNFSGSGGNTYTGAGQTNPITGEYMGSVEF